MPNPIPTPPPPVTTTTTGTEPLEIVPIGAPSVASWIIGGRKFLLVAIALLIYGAIVLTKANVTAKEALDGLIWILGIGVSGIALEDGLGKLRKS